MEKKIICIGYDLPGHLEFHHRYSSNQSLLDADIILFEPSLYGYSLDKNPYFQGKRCFSKDSSFKLKEATSHWKSELSTAIESGKTVIVFLSNYEEVYLHTGRSSVSGTGRNAQTTNLVDDFNNFEFFPIPLPKIIPKQGKEIKFSGNPIFSTYYSTFKNMMVYEAYLNEKSPNAIFLTRTGDKTIGALYKMGKGNLVLLPQLKYDPDKFINYLEKTGKNTWTKEAVKFGNSLLQEIINIDKALRKESENTPPPKWVTVSEYDLSEEVKLMKKIEMSDKTINRLLDEKRELTYQLGEVLRLKDLLFEKGKNLENAVGSALHILGYKAENFDNGTLELDQVILSPENDRFIGEIEGKDTSAVNIEKFRQLSLNIHEDLQREEVVVPAKGILFGNGFRLKPPTEREEQFTVKCITVAQTSNCILIRTCDLFPIVKYIQESGDLDFAKSCRAIIKNSVGKIVVFPPIPILAKEMEI